MRARLFAAAIVVVVAVTPNVRGQDVTPVDAHIRPSDDAPIRASVNDHTRQAVGVHRRQFGRDGSPSRPRPVRVGPAVPARPDTGDGPRWDNGPYLTHATQPGQPDFRTGTVLVEVSAVVTSAGRPVTDLRADEVTVLDNGKPQQVVAFERVDLGRGEQPGERRDFVLVLDDLHIDPRRTQPTLEAASGFVDRLGPHDRVAVVRTASDERIEFSADRASARKAIRAFRGQAVAGPSIDGQAQLLARMALDVVARVAESLRGDAVERRALLLFSEGHTAFQVEPALNPRQDVRDVYLRFLEVLRQAAVANVAIYTVDPRGLRAPGAASTTTRTISPAADALSLSSDLMSSLAALASETGGIQTRWTNDLTANFARLIQDSRQYYRIAYVQPDPPAGKKQPLTRRITLKVSRRDVDVRARQRYAPVPLRS